MNNNLKNFYNELSGRGKSDAAFSDDAKMRVRNGIFSKIDTQLNELERGEVFTLESKIHIALSKGYILVPMVCVMLIAGATIASANSLPGDKLYPLKRQVENARLLITPNEEDKVDLEVTFAQKRLEEADKVKLKNVGAQDLEKSKDDSNASKQESSRLIKARNETNNALKFLNQTKENWEHSGKGQRAKEIEVRIQKFQSEHKLDQGEVRGAKTGRNN